MANKNDNLKKRVPFKKGDPRINRAGRSPKLPELDKLLADVLGEEKDGVTAAEAILKALRMKAAKGDIRAAEVLLDRGYGKAKQSHSIEGSIDMTHNAGIPIKDWIKDNLKNASTSKR